MGDKVVLVTHKQSAFARHVKLLGHAVREIREPALQETEWEAIYWELSSMCDLVAWNSTSTCLLRAPGGCTRILDFDIKDIATTQERIVRESLTYCDLLKIGKQELSALCHLLGIVTKNLFDSCCDLMAMFSIETLILSHGESGCHIFRGNAISEKWGHLSYGDCTAEEAEGAFTAAYLIASQGQSRVFTDYHRQALEYLKRVCRPKC
ncbi:MAG: hypothetical protein IJ155_09515 [Prevotella sp.]|nr:hypothetical protein [Prevotella sp.]